MIKEKYSIYEVLVKTSYQTQSTEPSDTNYENPRSFGSGFIVSYKNKSFFITSDHNIHLDDYSKEVEKRTGKEYNLGVFNNVNLTNGKLETVLTPLSGFYYMDSFKLNNLKDSEPYDLAVCLMKELNFQYPFLSEEIMINDVKINGGEKKLFFKDESFAEPTKEKSYYIYGKIRNDLGDIILKRESTLKSNLKLLQSSGDYYIFETQELVIENEWKGLSGSPVLSEEGECIGVLTSVRENSNRIWVLHISKVKMFMDVILKQEEIKNHSR